MTVPKLGGVNGISDIEIVKLSALRTAGYQDRAVGQDGRIVLAPGKVHRGNLGPRGIGAIEIDNLDDVSGCSAAYEHHLADVKHNRGSVVAVAGAAVSDEDPSALISRGETLQEKSVEIGA